MWAPTSTRYLLRSTSTSNFNFISTSLSRFPILSSSASASASSSSSCRHYHHLQSAKTPSHLTFTSSHIHSLSTSSRTHLNQHSHPHLLHRHLHPHPSSHFQQHRALISTLTCALSHSLSLTPPRRYISSPPALFDSTRTSSGAEPLTVSTSVPVSNSKRVPLFNTYRLVEQLKESGLSEKQAVCVMEALIAATSESQEVTYNTLATKADFSALKVQLNEKMFNSSLKYDMQQKHLREMFKSELDALKADMQAQARTIDSDFSAFRSDIRMSQKTDLFGLEQHIHRVEKEVENEKAHFRSEQERLENRLIKYALGFVASFGALVLTAIRLLMA